jgi:hypothetical protein
MEGNGATDEEPLESESDDENDAILHEKKDAILRVTIFIIHTIHSLLRE